jgi:N,N-dimethylformamidase beta subunit-like protein
MRAIVASLPLLLAALLTGSAPATVAPPRLLGLSISNGGRPFLGDTRQLATVTPNGDGLRDRVLVRFRLDRPGAVELQVVATADVHHRARLVWRTRRSFSAGPHRMVWKPRRQTPVRTYLLRFVVVGHNGGSRVYGFEQPRPGRLTSGLVVRVQGVAVTFLQRSYARGGQASVSVATDARSVSLRFLSYAGGGSSAVRDPRTNAVALTPPVRLDWRGHRGAPHTVSVAVPRAGSWPSGLYFLRVTAADGRVGYAPLILRPRRLGEHRIAVVLPTNTWQAFNYADANGDGWGDSWDVSPAIRAVDVRRPYREAGLPDRFRERDLGVIAWLKRTRKEVDYLSDDDLARVRNGDVLRRAYDLVVFPGREEYVTAHAYDVTRRFRDLGGRLIFLSASNFLWKVERRGPFLRRTGMWRRLGRPEAALVGVQSVAGSRRGREKPYVVQGALGEPWVFAGTGLENGSPFGRYGREIDARARSSPPGTVVLARISNAIGSQDAEMTLYRTSAGARVFAAGALGFSASIGLQAVSRLVDNVWSRLAGP